MIIETDIGVVVLTPNQKFRLSSLHGAVIKGFFIKNDEVKVKSASSLTAGEITQLKTDMSALSDADTPMKVDRTEYATLPFKNKTTAQIGAYIDSQVTDLASAKGVLKKMAKVIVMLARRTDLK